MRERTTSKSERKRQIVSKDKDNEKQASLTTDLSNLSFMRDTKIRVNNSFIESLPSALAALTPHTCTLFPKISCTVVEPAYKVCYL